MRSILLTWDIEEFDAPEDFGAPRQPDGGLAMGNKIWGDWLNATAEWKAIGTCFVTSRLAAEAPDLVHATCGRGHEIASHGWSHEKGADLRLQESRGQLEKLCGTTVSGFRSPRLVPVPVEEIKAAGFRYDASSNPAIVPGRYCRAGEKRKPHLASGLWEVPASVLPLLRFPLFWAGFHLLPLPLYQAACRVVLATDGLLSLYFHPWELAELKEPQFPHWLRRRSQSQRLERMEKLVRWLGTVGTYRTIGSYLDGIRVTRP